MLTPAAKWVQVLRGNRGDGPPLRAAPDVPVNGSLEAAGRRVALFSRLMDEHSLASLLAAVQARNDLDPI